MIVLQSTATGHAERPADNPKSARGMSSLEERGEGSSHRGMAEADEGELNICRSRGDEALIAKPPAIPQPKSTLPHPKSTVDLGCEELIWVENTLISSPAWRSPARILPNNHKLIGRHRTKSNQRRAENIFYHS
jgi:hypothetical protein